MTAFAFFDVEVLRDGELELVLQKKLPADPIKNHVPGYVFEMHRSTTDGAVGLVGLRIGHQRRLALYAGHIGYRVDPNHRGRHFAARSVKLLLPLAGRHGIDPLWITCNPENLASRRTCELAGGIYVETVDVPKDDEVYAKGDRRKCRYRFDLGAPEAPAIEIREITHNTPDYTATVALRESLLRRPLGLTFPPAELAAEEQCLHIAAFSASDVVGCLLLEPREDGAIQMRQVAVAAEHQGRNIGTQLVAFAETLALKRGFTTMVLNARRTAVPFYERLGYSSFGAEFIEVTIPHRRMQKDLLPGV